MSWVGAEPSSKQPSKQPRDACGNTVVTQEGTFGPGAAVNMAMGQHRTPGTPVKLSALGGGGGGRGGTHPHACTRMTAPIPTHICTPGLLHACTVGTLLSTPPAPQGHLSHLAPEGWG